VQKTQQIQEQKEMILEQALTQEALARLGRIKMVKPEKVSRIGVV
jgi:DNA-binding TFAR19-related protein (PDSD5 family)